VRKCGSAKVRERAPRIVRGGPHPLGSCRLRFDPATCGPPAGANGFAATTAQSPPSRTRRPGRVRRPKRLPVRNHESPDSEPRPESSRPQLRTPAPGGAVRGAGFANLADPIRRSGCGHAGGWGAACSPAAESAKADFVKFQRRLHSLTGRKRRSPVPIRKSIVPPGEGAAYLPLKSNGCFTRSSGMDFTPHASNCRLMPRKRACISGEHSSRRIVSFRSRPRRSPALHSRGTPRTVMRNLHRSHRGSVFTMRRSAPCPTSPSAGGLRACVRGGRRRGSRRAPCPPSPSPR
jgi:hypothetical protein